MAIRFASLSRGFYTVGTLGLTARFGDLVEHLDFPPQRMLFSFSMAALRCFDRQVGEELPPVLIARGAFRVPWRG